MASPQAKFLMNPPLGFERVILITLELTTSTELMPLKRPFWALVEFSSRALSIENLTSDASKSLPLWNFTFSWSWNVYTNPSSDIVHDLAKPGVTDPSARNLVKPSYTLE